MKKNIYDILLSWFFFVCAGCSLTMGKFDTIPLPNQTVISHLLGQVKVATNKSAILIPPFIAYDDDVKNSSIKRL